MFSYMVKCTVFIRNFWYHGLDSLGSQLWEWDQSAQHFIPRGQNLSKWGEWNRIGQKEKLGCSVGLPNAVQMYSCMNPQYYLEVGGGAGRYIWPSLGESLSVRLPWEGGTNWARLSYPWKSLTAGGHGLAECPTAEGINSFSRREISVGQHSIRFSLFHWVIPYPSFWVWWKKRERKMENWILANCDVRLVNGKTRFNLNSYWFWGFHEREVSSLINVLLNYLLPRFWGKC